MLSCWFVGEYLVGDRMGDQKFIILSSEASEGKLSHWFRLYL
jgi:hypothetical protein